MDSHLGIRGGGVFYVRSLGGGGGEGGKFVPTFYFLIMHVMSLKIGLNVFNHVHLLSLIKEISGKVHFCPFSCSLFLVLLKVL